MKNGKFILSAAAFVVTAASALAFKAAHKFGQTQMFGTASTTSGCPHVTCWTSSTGSSLKTCKTVGAGTVATTLYKTATCSVAYTGKHVKASN